MAEVKQIPYKIYLEEQEMPEAWYNVRADMKNKPAPLLNPETLEPMTAEELGVVFCDELVKQELDNEIHILRSRKRSAAFTKCTVHLHWYVHTAWKKNSRLRQKSIINLKEIIQVEVIN